MLSVSVKNVMNVTTQT